MPAPKSFRGKILVRELQGLILNFGSMFMIYKSESEIFASSDDVKPDN